MFKFWWFSYFAYLKFLLSIYKVFYFKNGQLCPTLCDPLDGNPPGSSVPGILQTRMEWVAISFSNAWKWKVKVNSINHVQPFVTQSTAAY